MINFQPLVLLDETVTEVILNEDTETVDATYMYLEPKDTNLNRSLSLGKNIRYSIREDSLRVKYPSSHEFPSFRTVDANDLIHETEIADGVVNCPFYHPRDTDVIRKELENLEHFRGVRGLVQSAGIAVFSNPYATSQEDNQHMVIKGILLKYYSGGSLQRILEEQRVTGSDWGRWAVQIGNALDTIHRAKKTHMDLKPSNIVLDRDGNAILIDISGIGGVTRKWLAPEIQDEPSLFDLPFQTRRLNDVWAYGKVLKEIASKIDEGASMKALNMVADHLTQDIPTRWTLSEAISQLENRQNSD